MVPEIEIKVSESGTITEVGNIAFQFRDNEYLFIYLFIYLFCFFWVFVVVAVVFKCQFFKALQRWRG